MAAPSARTDRRVVAIVVTLTLLGLGLRLWRYGYRLPWVDEAETRLLVEAGPWAALEQAFDGPPVRTPPLYFALVAFLDRLGLAGAHLRLPSVLLSAASIPALFSLGRRVHSLHAGVIAAALLAVAPLHVRYAQEARPYALLGLVAIVFLHGAIDPVARVRLVIGGVLCALSQYPGALLVAAVLPCVILLRRDGKTLLASSLPLAAAGLTLAQLANGLAGGAALLPHLATVHVPFAAERALGIVAALGGAAPDAPRLGLALTLPLWLAGLVVLARRSPRVALILVVAAAVPIVVLASPPSTYVFSARYAIQVVPIGALLAAVALATLRERGGVLVATGLLGALAFVCAPQLATMSADRGTRYDLVGEALAQRKAGKVALVLWDEPLAYYGPREVAALRPYLAAGTELAFVSGWPGSVLPRGTWLVTVSQPLPDLPETLQIAPEAPFGPLQGLVLGRAAASARLYLYPPR